MENPCTGQASLPILDRLGRRLTGLAQRFHRRTQGGALIEFAVTLPILLLTITGVFSFSTVIYQKLELTEAVCSGGRVMAADRGATDPCADTVAAIEAAAPTLSPSSLSFRFQINGGTATTTTSCTGTSGASNMTAGGTASVGAEITSCTLKAYKYTFPGCVISSQVVEEVQ
jgi:Flp pilus assembly protein TadG